MVVLGAIFELSAYAPTAGGQAQDAIDPERGLVDESQSAVAIDDERFDAGPDDAKEGSEDTRGAFLFAGKLGGGIPFSELGGTIAGAIEIGYLFRRSDPSFGVYLDVSYFVPQAEGSAVDPRLASNGDEYSWQLWQKELAFQPTFLYRLAMLDEVIVPYAGIGPRLYLLETVIEGEAGGARFPISEEVSTKLGFGLPLGAEITLGPGGVIAELLFQWGPLPHDITGDTHLASASLWVGYRALL